MYIDPNTGGMLFQILAVMFGLFSAIIFFFSSKIRTAFAKLRRQIRERRHGTEKSIPNDETPSTTA
jgi:hypothetical protein